MKIWRNGQIRNILLVNDIIKIFEPMKIPKTILIAWCLVSVGFMAAGRTCMSHAGKSTSNSYTEAPRVLLITAGHSFEREPFYEMIFSLEGIKIDTISQPYGNRLMLSGSIEKYDVIMFYDMWQEISEEEKKAFVDITQRGTGLVFLHHSLVSYQLWDEIIKIRGGKYYQNRYDYPPEKYSGYKHDIIMNVRVLDPAHQVTAGIEDFEIEDEGYSNIEVLPEVTPLLATEHPDCSDIIAWAHSYNKSRVIYLLFGHDNKAWSNDNFQRLVTNSINWVRK